MNLCTVYASQQHEQFLPDGTRAGFLIGDGAGVGKGRTIAGNPIYSNLTHLQKKRLLTGYYVLKFVFRYWTHFFQERKQKIKLYKFIVLRCYLGELLERAEKSHLGVGVERSKIRRGTGFSRYRLRRP